MDQTPQTLERVLFVHAHPDDESIATGGTIAHLRARGAEVCILTLTRGERGEVTGEQFAHLLDDRAALAAHRERELAAAFTALGVTAHFYLGEPGARREGLPPRRYEDSGMRWLADGHAGPLSTVDPGTLTGADPHEVAVDVATAVAAFEPTAVISYDADGGYGHPDHELAHRVSALAAEVLGVPFYAIVPPASATERDVIVDVRPHAHVKRAALAAHASQLSIDGDDIVHSGGQRQPIELTEAFRRHRADATVPLWQGLGLGGRLGLLAVIAVFGLLVGTVTTLTHQWRITVLGEWVWIGTIIGLTALALVLVGLRAQHSTRLPAFAFALGAYTAVSAFTLFGPGGDVVVPANDPGWWWVFGSAILAAVIIAWPRLSLRLVA